MGWAVLTTLFGSILTLLDSFGKLAAPHLASAAANLLTKQAEKNRSHIQPNRPHQRQPVALRDRTRRVRPRRVTERSFILMIRLEGGGLNQLVPDRDQEGCRALHRMLAPVLQNDSGTFLQSLNAVPVAKSLPPTRSGRP
jgi:hypothetical protein